MKQKALKLIDGQKPLFENFNNIYIPQEEFNNYYKKLIVLFSKNDKEKIPIIEKNYSDQIRRRNYLKKKERNRLIQLNSIFSDSNSIRELDDKYNYLKNLYKNNTELKKKINTNIKIPYFARERERKTYKEYKKNTWCKLFC
jgi:hypothetical protein